MKLSILTYFVVSSNAQMNKPNVPNYNYSWFYLLYFDDTHCTALDPIALTPLIVYIK